jgi:hypothetical protein
VEGGGPVTTRSRFPGGFILLELVLVVAVIAVLAALIFVSGAAARERARQVTCMNNLQQIGVAMAMYAADYPARTRVESVPHPCRLHPDYVSSPEVFVCPDDYERDRGCARGDPRTLSYICPVILGTGGYPELEDLLAWKVYRRRGEQMPVMICDHHIRPDQLDAWEQPPVTWIVLRIDGSVERVRKPGWTPLDQL